LFPFLFQVLFMFLFLVNLIFQDLFVSYSCSCVCRRCITPVPINHLPSFSIPFPVLVLVLNNYRERWVA
jgi:hypothetical protein